MTTTKMIEGTPIYSMAECKEKYLEHLEKAAEFGIDLSRWLPGLSAIRPLVGGELATVIADTGVGKSCILQNIAAALQFVPTIFFSLELPNSLMFERFAQITYNLTGHEVEEELSRAAVNGTTNSALNLMDVSLNHVWVCDKTNLDPPLIEEIVETAEKKSGVRPRLVIVDYIGLIKGQSNRYERLSDAAEQLKVVAKNTDTVVIMASQMPRRERQDNEVSLYDAKGSGSIEASSGLVLGAWRDKDTNEIMHIKVLKNTKGGGGTKVMCKCDWKCMRIEEVRDEIEEEALRRGVQPNW